MRNNYKINGSTTVIYLDRKDGSRLETYIDTKDLDRLLDFNVKWYADYKRRGNRYYVQTKHKGKTVYLHRFLLKAESGEYVDHEDHDSLNNRSSSNLRITTNAENNQNRSGAYSNNTTGVRGVTLNKKTGKYQAFYNLNYKKHHVGTFDTLEQAEFAVVEARRKYMTHSS